MALSPNTYTCMYTHTHTHTHTDTHTHRHTDTQTHTHTQLHTQSRAYSQRLKKKTNNKLLIVGVRVATVTIYSMKAWNKNTKTTVILERQ